jgi:hypothetical protein
MAATNLERARAVYRSIRDYWIARGSALEAHDRLSIITVAAGLRPFAFLTRIDRDLQSTVARLLKAEGLSTHTCSSIFDLDIEPEGISVATVEAYTRVQRKRSCLDGLGVWGQAVALLDCAGMIALGGALSYPQCCEILDLRTKQRDHELFLTAIVKEEGDDPGQVERALLERREYSKASYDHCQEWNDRFMQTLSRFPFVLHTACDACLRVDPSPTGILNRQYENLAASVSEELHLMVRWGARALTDRSDEG